MESPLHFPDLPIDRILFRDETQRKCDFFNVLPLDVKCEIFSNLTPALVLRCRTVCKVWRFALLHDSIWKTMTDNVFGVAKKDHTEESWFSLFVSLEKRWKTWDSCAHHPGISVGNEGKVAECDPHCKNDTHLPLRGGQGVKSGRHFFEVSFKSTFTDGRPTAFSSLLCAVGIADKSFITDRKVGAGYTKDNNGIGYYSSGFQFLYGKEVNYGNRVTYNIHNKIGILLDMDIGEVQFFRDGKPTGERHKLNTQMLGKVELYPLVLSERGLVITIQDSKIPACTDEARMIEF